MTKLSLNETMGEKIYFKAAWLKPGKTSYVIERTTPHQTDTEIEKDKLVDLLTVLDGRDSPQLKIYENNRDLENRRVYVHQMLTNFRIEDIPKCK